MNSLEILVATALVAKQNYLHSPSLRNRECLETAIADLREELGMPVAVGRRTAIAFLDDNPNVGLDVLSNALVRRVGGDRWWPASWVLHDRTIAAPEHCYMLAVSGV